MKSKTDVSSADSFCVSYEDDNGSFFVISRYVASEEENGFIVVSDVNRHPVVLAYDTSSSFRADNLPSHIRTWFDSYAHTINTTNEVSTLIDASSYGTETVPPLLGSTMWNQDEPYNILCPDIDGEKCPTGCVATAIAQIMNFHKYPQKGNGYCHYTTYTNKLDISFDFENTWFQWDNIYERYGALSVEQEDEYHVTNYGSLEFLNFSIDVGSSSLLNVITGGFFANGAQRVIGDLALLLLNPDGVFVTQISEPTSINIAGANGGGEKYSFPVAVPSDINDGEYKICVAFRATGEKNWDIVLNPVYTSKSYIEIRKADDMVYVRDKDYPCASSLEHSLPVATLMEAAGAAVKMDYAPGGSGAFNSDVIHGLNQYFSYDNDMALLSLEDYSDSLWHRTLQRELLEGRPVYYTGSGASGGHAFVIDGMQTNEANGLVYYHVNWGWGGLCDGYYLLNMLRPSSAGTGGTSGTNYANNAGMVIGIMPEDGIDHLRMSSKGLLLSDHEYFPGQNLSFDIESLNLQSASAEFEGTLYLDLIREDANEEEDTLSLCLMENLELTSNRGLTGHHARIVLSDDIAPGKYRLSLSCRGTNGEIPEISMGNAPVVDILSIDDWKGGVNSTTHQYVSIGGCTIDRTSSTTERMSMTIETLTNQHSTSVRGQVSILVCDSLGLVLMPLDESNSLSIGGYAQKVSHTTGGAFSKNMPDGYYRLRLGFMPNDSDKWSFLYQASGSEWTSELSIFEIPFESVNGIIIIDGMQFSPIDYPWTSIDSVTEEDKCDNVTIYDISGRKVHLERGKQIYIKKGRKYIKKY